MLCSFCASYDPSVFSVAQAFSLVIYNCLRVFLPHLALEPCLKGIQAQEPLIFLENIMWSVGCRVCLQQFLRASCSYWKDSPWTGTRALQLLQASVKSCFQTQESNRYLQVRIRTFFFSLNIKA